MRSSELVRFFVREMLFEAKSDDLKKKYPDKAADIDNLVSQRMKSKYLEWAVKQLIAGAAMSDLVPSIAYFDKNWQRFKNRDINSYTAKSLEDTVKDLGFSSKKKSKESDKLDGAEKIAERNNVVLLFIKSKKGSICYGSGTRWCITMDSASYYDDYTSEGVLFYFLIDKNLDVTHPMHKVAFVVYRTSGDVKTVSKMEIFDAEDDRINSAKLSDTGIAMLSIIKSDAPSRPEPPSPERGNMSDAQVLEWYANLDEYGKHGAFDKMHPKYFHLFLNMPETYVDLIYTIDDYLQNIHSSKEGRESAQRVIDALVNKNILHEAKKLIVKNCSYDLVKNFIDDDNYHIRRQVSKRLSYKDALSMIEKEVARPDFAKIVTRNLLYIIQQNSEKKFAYWTKKVEETVVDRKKFEVMMPYDEIIKILASMDPEDRSPKSFYDDETGEELIAYGHKIKTVSGDVQARIDLYNNES